MTWGYQTVRDFMYGQSPGWKSALLFWPLSLISLGYLVIVKARNRLFDWGLLPQTRLGAKVVSVGNLTVGGTGKTPWTIFLARALSGRGFKVAVLSRGYGSKRRDPVTVVTDGTAMQVEPEVAGDEPALIAKRCPGVAVVLGAKRVDSGRHAIETLGADLLLLDDGFQHRHLARDVDLVNFHGRLGVGKAMLTPAGLLREPLSSLNRASAAAIHGDGPLAAPVRDFLGRQYPKLPVFRSRLAYRSLVSIRSNERVELEKLNGTRVLAFCGIASPEALFEQVGKLGPARLETRGFRDHHDYSRNDIGDLQSLACDRGVEYIVTSEKDAMKIDPRWISDPGDVFYLEAELEIEGGPEPFLDWLEGMLNR